MTAYRVLPLLLEYYPPPRCSCYNEAHLITPTCEGLVMNTSLHLPELLKPEIIGLPPKHRVLRSVRESHWKRTSTAV